MKLGPDEFKVPHGLMDAAAIHSIPVSMFLMFYGLKEHLDTFGIWTILNLWFEVDEVEVFSDDSTLREYNYLVGYLQVLFSMDKLVSSFHGQKQPMLPRGLNKPF